MTGAAAEAECVLSVGLAQADQNVSLRSAAGRAEAREILEMLERADQQLERRLRREAERFGPTERFTGAGLLAYRRQVQLVNAFVRNRMGRNSRRAAWRNIRQGWFDTVGLLGGLEEAFTGSVRPLRINTARMMNERTRGVQASLLRQHATSMDRYGEEMERTMRQTLQSNLLAGGSFSQAVDQLVAMRGPRGRVSVVARELGDGTVERIRLETIPEGLFRRHRWWAMRIVRTETAYAQNAAGFEALHAARDHDFPDMQKKILAMMDNRTAPDSIAVHGQIRDLDATFRDGAGREYLHPPARPNDREVVIPWRPGWDETETSAPRPSLEEAIQRATEERGTETLPQPEVAEAIEEQSEEERIAEVQAARIVERRTLLQRQGWDREAIDRDLLEMGAPEATRESLAAIAQEARHLAAPLAAGEGEGRLTAATGRGLRVAMRRIIRTIDPNFATQDLVERAATRGAYTLRRKSTARAGGLRGWHTNRGELGMRNDQLAGAARALVRIADGEELDAHDFETLHTFIHEEHHGASPAAHGMAAYRGQGTLLEEAAVESRARGMTNQLAEIVGRSGSTSPRELPFVRRQRPARGEPAETSVARASVRSSYQAYVEQLHLAVGEVTGLGRDGLRNHVQQRLATQWFIPRRPGEGPRTPDEMVDQMAAILYPEDPERMARELRRRMQAVSFGSERLEDQPEEQRRRARAARGRGRR